MTKYVLAFVSAFCGAVFPFSAFACAPANGGGNAYSLSQSAAASLCVSDAAAHGLTSHCSDDGVSVITDPYTGSGGSYVGTSCYYYPSAACPALGSVGDTGYLTATSYSLALTAAAGHTCKGSCGLGSAVVTQLPDLSQNVLVNGVVNHDYAVTWPASGVTCSGTVGTVSSTPVTSTCPTGQFLATVNGIAKCYTPAGQLQSSADASTAACTTTTSNSTVTNGDGSKTVTTTATDNCTGKSTSSTQTYASGVTPPVVPSSTTTVNNSSSSSISSGTSGTSGAVTGVGGGPVMTSENTPGQDMTAFCATNPNTLMCQNKQTDTLPGDPDPASLGNFSDAFFSGTFSNLLSWHLPSHTSTCPALTLTLFGGTASMTSHCTIVSSIQTNYGNVMILVWTFIALFVVLGA